MVWDTAIACFRFICSFADEKFEKLTRRIILSTYSRIFDPLGFIQPFVLHHKLIIQELSRLGLSWDDEVQPNNKKE